MEFKGNSLGDITGMIKQELPDLSWLIVDVNTVPVVSNPNHVVPELVEAWTWEEPRNAPASLVPNSISCPPPVRVTSPDEIADAVKAKKKLMMMGITGSDLDKAVASKVDPDVLEAAGSELSKLASQEGLLGHVYMDLSPFDTSKEAASFVGTSRLRLASFAVGAPAKEASFLDPSGNVRHMGLPHSASTDVGPALLSKYAATLAGSPGYSHCKIASVEDLRSALASGPQHSVRRYGADEAAPLEAPSADLLPAAVEATAAARDKQASDMLWHRDRQLLGFMQAEMVKGKTGSSLRDSLLSKYSSDALEAAIDRVQKFAALQGLLGRMYVDVALPDSADDAISMIKRASLRPSFVMSSRPECESRLERVAQATGCSVLSRAGVTADQAKVALDTLAASGRLSSGLSLGLKTALASGENPTVVTKTAFLSADTSYLTVSAQTFTGGVQASFGQGDKVGDATDSVDREHLKQASAEAIKGGFSLSAIEGKVASSIPAAEATSLVKSALSSVDVVPARTLERCASLRYALKLGAKIAAAPKCASCVHAISGTCSKQAAELVGAGAGEQVVKMASVDPSQEFGLCAPSLDVRMSSSPAQALPCSSAEFSLASGLIL